MTTATAREALDAGEPAKALAAALQLGHAATLAEVVAGIRLEAVDVVVRGVPPARAAALLRHLAACLTRGREFEFHATWLRALLRSHGDALRGDAPALREAQKALALHKRSLAGLIDDNDFALAFLAAESRRAAAAEE